MKKATSFRLVTTILLAFAASQSAWAQGADKITLLNSFSAYGKGGFAVNGTLAMDSSGNLYGAAGEGGLVNGGTIFELSPQESGHWNFQVIFQCDSNPGCENPIGSLAIDQAGNLYGATEFGQIFELSNNGSGTWTATSIYNLAGDGTAPGPVIIDTAGNLYGVNAQGGANNLGFVFELSLVSGTWVLTDLHDFAGPDGSGCCTLSSLIMDSVGNLYGTTPKGGSSTACPSGCGVVFELSNNSGTWSETVLHSFSNTDGALPEGPLTMAAEGKLFGSVENGGPEGFGAVFELLSQSGGWKFGIVHSFRGGNDGAYPDAPLVIDSAGNLYGTTSSGGGGGDLCTLGTSSGCGTAFELTYSGTSWHKTLLHAFTGAVDDGAFPQGLISGGQSDLFGLASEGGREGWGATYELTPKTSGTESDTK
jgi:uncharacterized repeat protein (TIGR03803 family)